ncbi:hypothetical protein ACFWAT_16325 [Streptomyces syringium]
MDVHESVLDLVGGTPLVRPRTADGPQSAAAYANTARAELRAVTE